MEIYKGSLELLDFVFYATMERGKVYETGSYIHNYALAYALRVADSPPYYHRIQKPNYETELNKANEHGLYITPAKPVSLTYRQFQFNTIAELYSSKKWRSMGFPDWGMIRALKPESRFEFFVVLKESVPETEFDLLKRVITGERVYIRLGKFPGKAKVLLQKADKVSEPITGNFTTELLLNWRDLEDEPKYCDIHPAALPTKLIANAYFQNSPYIKATFGEQAVHIPLRMQFIAKSGTPTRERKKNEPSNSP